MAIQTFEDLEVWKRSSLLTVTAHLSIQNLKEFALKDQIARCSLSIPSNIAEGIERDSPQDTIRFLRIAKGSCAELRTQLFISQKINQALSLPPLESITSMIQETREISAMLQGLIQSIQKRASP